MSSQYLVHGVACALLAGVAGEAAAQGQISSSSFNPAISLILDGRYANYSEDPATYAISSFPLAEEAGPPAEGFSLGESEFVVSANIDDRYYGYATFVFALEEGGEAELEIEEVWLQTLTLPAGLRLKAGKFLSGIGYHNSRHAHTWDFVDAPLAYQALLGTAVGDPGLQLHWLAPTALFVELGAELMRGDAFPGAGAANSGVGAWSLSAHAGGDVGTSHSWRAGISYLSTDAEGRETALDDGLLAFTGSSDVFIVDFVWKWARNGNPRDRNFVVQGEYLQRDEDGTIGFDGLGGPQIGTYDGSQDGFYLQGVYQFRPKWRVGARYDRLSADNALTGLAVATPLDDDGRDPSRITAMVDYSHSEFSRLRFQVAEDKSRPASDTQFFLQYIMSLGSHGAHQF